MHKTPTLNEMLQRSITDNYMNIKEYILSQDERFFNSLVLAVYDGDPKWVEVVMDYGDGEEYYNMGFLDLSGVEKIFPVDGQHRVAGIKEALNENDKLENEEVPVIFIGHRNTIEGKQRTRRLFSTLNRYAKPVSMRDIIALYEDDVVAIVTRELVEEFELFTEDRIVYGQQKAIPDSNKKAFTSIITLYQCNYELLKYYLARDGNKKVKEYIKIRPSSDDIDRFKAFCWNYWENFSESIEVIKQFLDSRDAYPANNFRNQDGGNILFRPIGLLPFTMAVIEINKRSGKELPQIMQELNSVNLTLNIEPWTQVLWNEYENKMLASDNYLVKMMLIYLVDKSLLKDMELKRIQRTYASKISYGGNLKEVLESF